MQELTNNFNIPASIVKSIIERESKYSRGDADFSVSQIIDSPRIYHLFKLNAGKIEIDVSEKIKAWLGSLIHAAIQKNDHMLSGVLSSGRVKLSLGEYTVSGEPDVYDSETKTIRDYKTTSVFSFDNDSKTEMHEKQINGYAMLFRSIGFDVLNGEIVYIFTDWSKKRYEQALVEGKSYPKPIEIIPVKIWDFDEQVKFFSERIRLFADSKVIEDCTDEEKWKKDDVYLIYKNNNKTPTSRHYTLEEAKKKIEELKAAYPVAEFRIEIQKGEAIRCKYYCPVAEFCDTNPYRKER